MVIAGNYWRGHQIRGLEFLTDLACRHGHRNGFQFAIHDLSNRGLWGLGENSVQGQATEISAVRIDDKQRVRVRRQFAAHAHVAHHHFQCHVRAHRHRVGVHQAAGGVRVVLENGFQTLAIRVRQGAHDLARDGLR